jgi:hypothetical protein
MPGINETVSVKKTIRILNRALKADHNAVNALMCARVRCNEELADDPTIQVSASNEVGLLGFINGLFGSDAEGLGTIAGVWAVICPADKAHKVDNERAGEPCRICGEQLVQGRLLRFQDLERR